MSYDLDIEFPIISKLLPYTITNIGNVLAQSLRETFNYPFGRDRMNDYEFDLMREIKTGEFDHEQG
jgi:hypothetical protein